MMRDDGRDGIYGVTFTSTQVFHGHTTAYFCPRRATLDIRGYFFALHASAAQGRLISRHAYAQRGRCRFGQRALAEGAFMIGRAIDGHRAADAHASRAWH